LTVVTEPASPLKLSTGKGGSAGDDALLIVQRVAGGLNPAADGRVSTPFGDSSDSGNRPGHGD
jgi:hypothetical protein